MGLRRASWPSAEILAESRTRAAPAYGATAFHVFPELDLVRASQVHMVLCSHGLSLTNVWPVLIGAWM